jgi:hypothetical protein
VVRKHRVGSSPTSGTQETPATKIAKGRLQRKCPGVRAGALYCNASVEGFIESTGRADLHVGEHMRVGMERDSDVGVTQHLRDDLGVDVLREQQCRARVRRRSWKRVVSGSFVLEKRLELARGDIAAVEGRAELTRGVARAPLPLGTNVAEPT